jgi:hypothetical protein
MDLVIANLLENLPVPTISNPSTSISLWNVLSKNFLESLFDFANEHLQDNGAMILIHGERFHLSCTYTSCKDDIVLNR